jgi:hypothetical protein
VLLIRVFVLSGFDLLSYIGSAARGPKVGQCAECWTPMEEVKVFWFFFSKKNTASFSEEKEAKRLLILGAGAD